LKSTSRAAGAEVVTSELFVKLFVAMNDAEPAFDVGFRGIAFAAFTAPLERKAVLRFRLS
jgi:hypothetical protein